MKYAKNGLKIDEDMDIELVCPVCGETLEDIQELESEQFYEVDFYCEECGMSGVISLDHKPGKDED